MWLSRASIWYHPGSLYVDTTISMTMEQRITDTYAEKQLSLASTDV